MLWNHYIGDMRKCCAQNKEVRRVLGHAPGNGSTALCGCEYIFRMPSMLKDTTAATRCSW